VQKVDPDANVSIYAGAYVHITEERDGYGTSARIRLPSNIVIDHLDNIYITSEYSNFSKLKRITSDTYVQTIQGDGRAIVDGNDSEVRYSRISGMAFDTNGNLIILDGNYSNSNIIRKTKIIHSITGTPTLTDVGDHDVNVSVTDGELSTNQEFKINVKVKPSLNVLVNRDTITYGENRPVFTHRIEGFLDGDDASILSGTIDYTYTIDDKPNAGKYAVTPTGLSLEPTKYILRMITDSLIVQKKSIRVSIPNAEVQYGSNMSDVSGFNVLYSGLNEGENNSVFDKQADVITDLTSLSLPGTVGSLILSGASDNNYSFNYQNGDVIVVKAPLDIIAYDAIKKQGETNPSFNVYGSGFKNEDNLGVLPGTVAFNTSAAQDSPAGNYNITPSGYGVSDKYTINFVDGQLTILPNESVNTTPRIVSVAPTNAKESSKYSYYIETEDDESDSLTVSVSNKPDFLNYIKTIKAETILSDKIGYSMGMTTDRLGNVYLSETRDKQIRKINVDGSTEILVNDLELINHYAIVTDYNLNVYVFESRSRSIFKYTPAGEKTVLYIDNDNLFGTEIYEMAIDNDNNLYIPDYGKHNIKKVSQNGTASVFAGSGISGNLDGNGINASFSNPIGATFDSSGNLIVSQLENKLFRKIAPNGDVTTYFDGSATMSQPLGLEMDKYDNLFIADYGNNKIFKLDKNLELSVFAGSTHGSVDGEGDEIKFKSPTSISLSPKNELFVLGYSTNKLRIVKSISKIEGIPTLADKGDHQVSVQITDGEFTAEQNFSINVKLKDFSLLETNITSGEAFKIENFDFDNDNQLDIVVLDRSKNIKLFKNNGNGSFVHHLDLDNTDFSARLRDINISDYDNDGDLDLLIVGQPASNQFSSNLFLNDGSGNFTKQTGIEINSPSTPYYMKTGDLDNDGSPEVVLAMNVNSTNKTYIYKVTSNLQFIKSDSILIGEQIGGSWEASFSNLQLVDYNNDANADILAQSRNRTFLLKNEGNLVFSDVSSFNFPGGSYGGIDVGDIDNDGDIDFLISNEDNTSKLISNDGNDVFSEISTPFQSEYLSYGDKRFFDFNNDGQIDILISDYYNNAYLKIFKNIGNTTFEEVLNNGLNDIAESTIQLMDFTNNGTLDILIGGYSENDFDGYVIKQYQNNTENSNTKPSVPNQFSVDVVENDSSNSVTFNWSGMSDDLSGENGLTYNLYLRNVDGDSVIVRPFSNLENGTLTKTSHGNTGKNRSWAIHNLYAGAYEWAVQAIDPNFMTSEFSPMQSLVVEKFNLKVTAFDVAKEFGAELPEFTSYITGFKGTDDISMLEGVLTYDKTADASSPSGEYTVTPKGYSSNKYKFEYVSGKFTILPENTAPTFTSIPSLDFKVDSLYNYPISVSDVEKDVIGVTENELPSFLKLDTTSTVSTFVETGSNIHRMAIDSKGNVYFTSGDVIKKVTPDGIITVFAGSTNGYKDGMSEDAKFNKPSSMAFDDANNLYVADTDNNKIRKITPSGYVTTLAGSSRGYADGIGAAAQFSRPYSIEVDSAGNVYVADTFNHKLRQISPTGIVTTFAGSEKGYADGNLESAKFDTPRQLAYSRSGDLYLVESSKLRKISKDGTVSTVVSSLVNAEGLSIDAFGSIYIAKFNENKFLKISPTGEIVSFAGTGEFADGEGDVKDAKFQFPFDIKIANDSIMYVSDVITQKIKKITSRFSLTGTPRLADVDSHSVSLKVSDGLLSSHQEFKFAVKTELIVIPVDTFKTYGSENPTARFTYIGFVNGETEEDLLKKPVSTSIATVESGATTEHDLTASGAEDEKYFFKYVSGKLTVNTAPLTVSVADTTRLYGDENPAFRFVYEGFVNNEDTSVLSIKPVASSLADKTTSVDTIDIKFTVNGEADNYTLTEVQPAKLTILPAPLTLELDTNWIVFGDEIPTPKVSGNGFKNDDSMASLNKDNTTITYSRLQGGNRVIGIDGIGEYDVNVTGYVSDNYEINESHTGQLKITETKLIIALVLDEKSRPYKAENPTYHLTYNGFKIGDTKDIFEGQSLNVTTSATVDSDTGRYTLTPSGLTSANYEIDFVSDELQIVQANATINIKDTIQYFDLNKKSVTVITEPKDLNTSILYHSEKTEPSSVGIHPVDVSILEKNYKGSLSHTLEIKAAPVRVKLLDDVSYNEDFGSVIVDLSETFINGNENNSDLKLSFKTESELVDFKLNGFKLILTSKKNLNGNLDLVINAETNNQVAADTIKITIIPQDDAPYVKASIIDVVYNDVDEKGSISLAGVFTDDDNDDSGITYSVKSANDALVSSKIKDRNTVENTFDINSYGKVQLVVTATSNGLIATDTLIATIKDITHPVLNSELTFSSVSGLDKYLYLYTFSDEQLKTNPKFKVITPKSTSEIETSKQGDANDFNTKYEVKEFGHLQFISEGNDVSGNASSDTVKIQLEQVNQGITNEFTLTSHFNMIVNPTSFSKQGFVYSKKKSVVGENFTSTENEMLNKLSSVVEIQASQMVSGAVDYTYDLKDVQMDFREKRKIGLYRLDAETKTWKHVGGQGKRDKLSVTTNEIGTMAVFYNEDYVPVPEVFQLHQNFPNPFNPTTTIMFDLPAKQQISLSIYNVLGQEVRRLVNESLDAGYHEMIWNGKNNYGKQLASGIYFYQLITPTANISKKMVLIK
jgi:sugar lactone lactonase YvrE